MLQYFSLNLIFNSIRGLGNYFLNAFVTPEEMFFKLISRCTSNVLLLHKIISTHLLVLRKE